MRRVHQGTQRVSPRHWLPTRIRPLLTGGLLLILLGATSAPAGASFVDPVATTDTVQTSTTTTTSTTFGEAANAITYSGTWHYAYSTAYQGGRVKYATAKGAAASFKFTGVKVSWAAPVGPTRGYARVYVDGVYIKAVNLYASTYTAKKVVWSGSFATQRARTLKIVVSGTSGHPTVAIDALTVTSTSTVGATAPIGTVTVNVSSIAGLKSALANNAIDRIVVANGTYRVSPSGWQASNSLWIGGGAIASRTRPVLVQAATRGGVVFDGGGGTGFSALSFEDGAHDQTWDGFVFANMSANQSGIIEFGGYVPRRTPHHITLQFVTIQRTCLGTGTYYGGPSTEHAIYIANAAKVGPNHLLIQDVSVDGRGGLASAVQFDHGDSTNPNASDVLVRRLHVVGTQQAMLLYTPAVHRITFQDVDVSGAISHAIRFESIGATDVLFTGIVSTNTGYQPFWSSMGLHPPGMSIASSSLH